MPPSISYPGILGGFILIPQKMYENQWLSPTSNPLGAQNIDQLRSQYQAQLETLNRMQKAQTSDILGQIEKELGALGQSEQSILFESQEYQMAKNVYESGFLQFISGKFGPEYAATGSGREAALGLLKVIQGSKEKIAYQSKVKAEKIEKVLEILESDPEMRKRYSELLDGKSSQKKSKK